MPTNFWVREVGSLFGPWAGPPGGGTVHLVDAPGTSHVNATVRRIILDVRLTTQVDFNAPGHPPVEWWQKVDFLVAAGVRGGAADLFPDSLQVQDHRVTLTGALRPTIAANTNILSNEYQVLEFSNRFELDSAGIRSSPIPGTTPIGCASLSVIDNGFNFATSSSNISWEARAWLRVLYRDP